MNKNVGILAGLAVIAIILFGLAVNFVLMPYLLMVVLGALGHQFSFWICLAFWVVFSAIARRLVPKVNKTVNHS